MARKIVYILFTLLICFCTNTEAKTPPTLNKESKDSISKLTTTEIIDTVPINFRIRSVVDSYKTVTSSILPTFPGAHNVVYDTVYLGHGEFFTDIIPEYSDSVIRKKINQLKSELPIEDNPYVMQWIKHYTTVGRNVPKAALGRSPYYYPLFEQIFAEEGIPDEVKHLAIIESGLKPFAVSKSGATGLWQFMHATGKYLNMKISYYVDDRRDIIVSTKNAAKYLNHLHNSFGDWLIAIAAYNCGPGTMRKAIRKSGYKTTYWEIRKYLPPETRNYIPALLAMTYCMNHTDEHYFIPLEPKRYHCNINLNEVDIVNIKEQLSFESLSAILDIPIQKLAFLNPGLKRNIIPFTRNGYNLKIPCQKVPLYYAMKDSLIKLEANRLGTLGMEYSYDKEHAYYKIQPGDNLSYIASHHDCTVRELMKWNGLTNYNIRAGKKLIVYKGVDLPSYTTTVKPSLKKNHNNTVDKSVTFYTIESGDTLWAISKKFPGTSVDSLKRVNKIYNSHHLMPGMVIKVTANI